MLARLLIYLLLALNIFQISYTCITKNDSIHPIAKKILDKITILKQSCATKEIQITTSKKKFILSPNQTLNINEILDDIPENIHTPNGILEVIYNPKHNNISVILLSKNGSIHLMTKQISTHDKQPEDTCSNLPKQNNLNSFENALDDFIYYMYTILFKKSCPPEKDNMSYSSGIIKNFDASKKYLIPLLMFFGILRVSYTNLIKQLNTQPNHTETGLIVLQTTIAIFLLNSQILNIIADFIIQIIFLFIEIGTIKFNICSNSLDESANLFQNAKCFIVKLLFGETNVITILTKILMIIIGIIISIIFPIKGIFAAITSAISIILILWIIFWIISFLLNIITNVLIQTICIMLLLYISPLIITLWPLESYLRVSLLKPFCRTMINNLISITITIFISNLIIFTLFNVNQHFALFEAINDIFNNEKSNMPAFFEFFTISFMTILNPFDITKIIPIFIISKIIMFTYPKILNFFMSRISNTSFLNINVINSQILQSTANKMTAYADKKNKKEKDN